MRVMIGLSTNAFLYVIEKNIMLTWTYFIVLDM